MTFHVVIPSRYASSRLPGKPLADIGGKPMVQHVVERARESGAGSITVATDDERILQAVQALGEHVVMTDVNHQSGSDRLAEACEKLNLGEDDIVVNVQGDEPFIPAQNIRQVAENLASSGFPMATLCTPITDAEEALNPNAVKVVFSDKGKALYFSRAPIPYDRDRFAKSTGTIAENSFYRHIGIYAYRVSFLKQFVQWPPAAIEQLESLEQLRALHYGAEIHVAIAIETPPPGVDTPADLQRANQRIAKR